MTTVVRAGSRKVLTEHVCPNCNEVQPTRKVEDVWVEDQLDDEWVAAYRIVAQEGRPVVGEVRVFPRGPRRSPGTWSAEQVGSRAKVPPGGLKTTSLRDVRLSIPHKVFPEVLQEAKRLGYDFLDLVHGLFSPTEIAQITEAGKHDDRWFAALAHDYLELVSDGIPPIKGLAERRQQTEGYMSQLVHEARSRGLLTASPSGRPGGQLTPKARKLLKGKD